MPVAFFFLLFWQRRVCFQLFFTFSKNHKGQRWLRFKTVLGSQRKVRKHKKSVEQHTWGTANAPHNTAVEVQVAGPCSLLTRESKRSVLRSLFRVVVVIVVVINCRSCLLVLWSTFYMFSRKTGSGKQRKACQKSGSRGYQVLRLLER